MCTGHCCQMFYLVLDKRKKNWNVANSYQYSSLSNKRDDGIKVVRGQNLKINKRGGWNKRGGGISMGKEITVTRSILKLEEC